MRLLTLITAIGLCCAGAAVAEPVHLASPSKGTTYFNRSGADMAAHDRALKACLLIAEEGIFGPPISLTGGIVPDLMAGGQQNFIRRANIENCMVVRGWRVIGVMDSPGGDLARLRGEALVTRLSTLVGAREPEGPVLRFWNNDATNPETDKGDMPGYLVGLNLSIQALTLDPSFKTQLATVRHLEFAPWKVAFARPTTIDQLDKRPEGSAVILITLRGAKKSNDTRLHLEREGPDRYATAPTAEGPVTAGMMLGKGAVRTANGSLEQTFQVIVPAGHWRLAGAGELVSFCMGAPVFNLEPGAVVYAGAFDFSKQGFGPDLSLDLIKLYLQAGAPKAAETVRAAAWVNGSVKGCSGVGMYGLEFPEFPFREGYVRAGEPIP
jgi:hypothetical protein